MFKVVANYMILKEKKPMSNPTASMLVVEDRRDIEESFNTFITGVKDHRKLTRDLLSRCEHWVYDPVNDTFAPSKFVGFKEMDFPTYQEARDKDHTGERKFCAIKARDAIENILGSYNRDRDPELTDKFFAWGESLFGPNGFNNGKELKFAQL